jgi:stress-induced morphogen
MIRPEEIERRVTAAIPGAHARARDLTGTLDHYELTVIAPAFVGQTLIERHRLVYASLAEPLKGPLHALTLKTYTPEEAQKEGIHHGGS